MTNTVLNINESCRCGIHYRTVLNTSFSSDRLRTVLFVAVKTISLG